MNRWWLLLIFAFNFVFISIKAERKSPLLRYYVAKTEFDYLKTNDEGVDEITSHNDYMLMVAVDDNHIVGPAQVQCRHINPPNEQIVNIAATTVYYPYEDMELIETKNFSYPTQCYQDTYGCISLVHNFCHIENHDVPSDFKEANTNAVLEKDAKKPDVGDRLKAVFFNITGESVKLSTKIVKVVDLEECKKLFDPDNVYLVDSEEQLCTERPFPQLGDDPIALPFSLFFRQSGDNYELIGIESKAEEGFSLSTWAPYHCRDKNVPCQ